MTFNESKEVPVQASARIKWWALALSVYKYTIACRTTKQHANADAMSRLPLPEMPENTYVPAEFVLLVEKIDDAPCSHSETNFHLDTEKPFAVGSTKVYSLRF